MKELKIRESMDLCTMGQCTPTVSGGARWSRRTKLRKYGGIYEVYFEKVRHMNREKRVNYYYKRVKYADWNPETP